jgi:hypothetical protein
MNTLLEYSMKQNIIKEKIKNLPKKFIIEYINNKYIVINKINDIFYYNYNEYINENRKIISLDLTNQQLIKYINNGIIKIIDE